MDCLRLRSPPAHFHYLISEQAKSLVALQELQNEVGALLEFRDLVIETFPNLRSKMSGPGGGCGGAGGRPAEWEAGVRVRRKANGAAGDKPKPQPSVQDSGFSTETSSSKEAHSSTRAAPLAAADELWTLLDAAQRRAAELCEPREPRRARALSSSSESPPPSPAPTPRDEFARALDGGGAGGAGGAGGREARELRRERDRLLDELTELEATALAGRARAARALAERRELEARLRDALEQRDRLERRLRAPEPPSPAPAAAASPPGTPAPATPAADRLGALDRVMTTPVRKLRVRAPDTKKIAAILKEDNPAELQRHLLSYTVCNQMLLERLQRVNRSKEELVERIEKMREENDDLRFQLDERRVESESAKSRSRAFEEAEEGGARSRSRDDGERESMRALGPLPDHLRMGDERRAGGARDRGAAGGATGGAAGADAARRARAPPASRIPLLGAKSLAPKPPSGRRPATGGGGGGDLASIRSRGDSSLGRPASAQSQRSGSLGAAAAGRDSLASARAAAASARRPARDSLGRARDSPASRPRDESPPIAPPAPGARAAPPAAADETPAPPSRRANGVAPRRPSEDAKSPIMRLKLNLWFPSGPRPESSSFTDSLDPQSPEILPKNIISEYLDRTDRLVENEQLVLKRICFPPNATQSNKEDDILIDEFDMPSERPQNLAVELFRSGTFAVSMESNKYTVSHLNSIQKGDSLWNGKPQQYFDSINNSDIMESDNSSNLNPTLNNVKREALAECDSLEKNISLEGTFN